MCNFTFGGVEEASVGCLFNWPHTLFCVFLSISHLDKRFVIPPHSLIIQTIFHLLKRRPITMDDTSDISNPAILAEVTAFLAQGSECQKRKLCRFLRAQSSHMHSAPDAILPTEEVAVKLGIIEELRKNEEQRSFKKSFHFSYIQLATLCLIPTETLQEFLPPKAMYLYSVLYPEHWLNIRMGPLWHLMSHSNSGLVIRWKHPADSIEDGRRGLPVISSGSRDEREKVGLLSVSTCQISIFY